jgi:hypothetical protein
MKAKFSLLVIGLALNPSARNQLGEINTTTPPTYSGAHHGRQLILLLGADPTTAFGSGRLPPSTIAAKLTTPCVLKVLGRKEATQ